MAPKFTNLETAALTYLRTCTSAKWQDIENYFDRSRISLQNHWARNRDSCFFPPAGFYYEETETLKDWAARHTNLANLFNQENRDTLISARLAVNPGATDYPSPTSGIQPLSVQVQGLNTPQVPARAAHSSSSPEPVTASAQNQAQSAPEPPSLADPVTDAAAPGTQSDQPPGLPPSLAAEATPAVAAPSDSANAAAEVPLAASASASASQARDTSPEPLTEKQQLTPPQPKVRDSAGHPEPRSPHAGLRLTNAQRTDLAKWAKDRHAAPLYGLAARDVAEPVQGINDSLPLAYQPTVTVTAGASGPAAGAGARAGATQLFPPTGPDAGYMTRSQGEMQRIIDDTERRFPGEFTGMIATSQVTYRALPGDEGLVEQTTTTERRRLDKLLMKEFDYNLGSLSGLDVGPARHRPFDVPTEAMFPGGKRVWRESGDQSEQAEQPEEEELEGGQIQGAGKGDNAEENSPDGLLNEDHDVEMENPCANV